MKKRGIYKIINIVNKKFYIGSSKDIDKRWKRHIVSLNNQKHENVYLQRSWNKYGSQNFEIQIVEEVLDENKLLEREQHYLDTLKPFFPTGYNISLKSSGGDNFSKNPNKNLIISKIKSSLKQTINDMSTEERQKKYARFGKNNGNYGKYWTDEQKEEARIRGKNFLPDENHLRKMVLGTKQSWENPKTRKIRVENISGENNPFYGKTHTDESKEQIRKTKKENFQSLSPEDRYKKYSQIRKISISNKIFYGISEAARKLNVSPATIMYRLKSEKYKEYKYLD